MLLLGRIFDIHSLWELEPRRVRFSDSKSISWSFKHQPINPVLSLPGQKETYMSSKQAKVSSAAKAAPTLAKLSQIYGRQPLRRDVYGRRAALPSEVANQLKTTRSLVQNA